MVVRKAFLFYYIMPDGLDGGEVQSKRDAESVKDLLLCMEDVPSKRDESSRRRRHQRR